MLLAVLRQNVAGGTGVIASEYNWFYLEYFFQMCFRIFETAAKLSAVFL